MKLISALFILLFVFVAANAQGGHEYAPIQEKEIKYKDWTFNDYGDSDKTNLRSFAEGKKLVMVVYFAPWCPNWHNEKPVAERLYAKYKNSGLAVIGVNEYGSLDELKSNLSESAVSFPIVVESEKRENKQTTTHYGYRKTTGDARNWGSPYNVFLEPSKLKKKGDVLTEKTFIVNGELIEAEAEKFIRQKLGLPATETAKPVAINASKTDVCKPTIGLKKP
ncbi:MAG: redoxin domain-containing protein [Pyrinomonadaceae bacterium]|nr:redoxin domain-containing protein [Pyrinomonadaceae bacterium]